MFCIGTLHIHVSSEGFSKFGLRTFKIMFFESEFSSKGIGMILLFLCFIILKD